MQEESNQPKKDADPSVEIIRGKLSSIYGVEPPSKQELEEVKTHHGKMSKHQKFMNDLSQSKRSLAEIQTAWHRYYQDLPEREKHQVWQEFYNERQKHKKIPTKPIAETQPNPNTGSPHSGAQKQAQHTKRTPPKDVRQELVDKIRKPNNPKSPHAKALFFGFSMGFVVILIFMFSFFNERFLTPFVRPSYAISSGTPIITDPTAEGKVGPEPKIIIPKTNVEAPVVYTEKSVEDKPVQNALEKGVLHYATTPNPGEVGNAVIFGHSSGNIFNKGKYKFAFLLLKSLDKGDTFILQKDGKRYVYKVFDKYITKPSDLSVLSPIKGHNATATLITCDPPGMSTNRLIIVADQIYPNPESNKPSTAIKADGQPTELASNSPSLWSRLISWL